MTLERDTLFILRAPFEDPALEGTWFCTSCATMEGVLLANPHWGAHIDVKRVPFPRPRPDVVALIGEANQSLPVLILADGSEPPPEAKQHDGRHFLDEPKPISRYLAARYSGAGPHP